MNDWLLTPEGGRWLRQAYHERGLSLAGIARQVATYPKDVHRAMVCHGIERRDRSAAQKKAVEAGRHHNPTRGRPRTPAERKRLSVIAKARNDARISSPTQAGGPSDGQEE